MKLTISYDEHKLLINCTSKDNVYPALSGVHFTKKGKSSIRVESCNARIAYFVTKKNIDKNIIDKLSGKTIKLPTLKKGETMVFDEYLEVITKNEERIFREYIFIEAKFPNIERFIKKRKDDFKVKLDTSILPKNIPIVLSINTSKEYDAIYIDEYGYTDNLIDGFGALMPMKREK